MLLKNEDVRIITLGYTFNSKHLSTVSFCGVLILGTVADREIESMACTFPSVSNMQGCLHMGCPILPLKAVHSNSRLISLLLAKQSIMGLANTQFVLAVRGEEGG